MQVLMEKAEFNRELSEARISGFEYACVVAHTINPEVANKMKQTLQDEKSQDTVERLISRLIK